MKNNNGLELKKGRMKTKEQIQICDISNELKNIKNEKTFGKSFG